jgi:5-methylcytosine-specific restriction enzyme subunit McrC
MAAGLRTGLQVFEIRNSRLYAKGVVGVMDIGDVVIEILPKTSIDAKTSDDAEFLGNLVRFAASENDLALALANIATGDGGLLEVVLRWAALKIDANLQHGAPRRYVARQEISTAIRGRVELRHLVHQSPGKAFELMVRYAPLHEDNLVNQVVLWLLREILQRTRSYRTRSLCVRSMHRLSGVRQILPTLFDVDRVVLSSTEAEWQPVIGLTRALLTQGQPDPTRGGGLSAVAVLFTMHDLFETALRRVLHEGLHPFSLRLERVSSHLLHAMDRNTSIMRLRPDFLVGTVGSPKARIVGDAKWKRIFEGPALPTLREDDVYQLVTYMSALQTETAFLVCPLQNNEDQPLRCTNFAVQGNQSRLQVIGIKVPILVSETGAGRDLRNHLSHTIASNLTSSSVSA